MPQETPILRPYREEDFESLRQAVGVVSRERKYLSFLDTPPLEAARAYVQECTERGDPRYVLAHAGAVVGWCDLTRFSDREVFRHRAVLGMGLLPGWRDKGHGLPLIEATIAAGWQVGYRRIELIVRADNLRAIALYRKVGFQEEGVSRGAFLVDGVAHDDVRMALLAPIQLGDLTQPR
ncbi:GNAT family N-acetyltransferase [Oryzibacter oryziterrae]|uniref:GNAT family N-acetyltransferase n=1 Tax=Oryzibacter oryziterrae TaxID=2766474 RepID=UPI001F3B5FF3|nr:GNAT family protein [Oryzibacter oryziterrae]